MKQREIIQEGRMTTLTWKWDEGKNNRLVYTADGTHIATFPHRKAINMGNKDADEGNDISNAAMLHLIKTFNTTEPECILNGFSASVKCYDCGKVHSVHSSELDKDHNVFQCECGNNYMKVEY